MIHDDETLIQESLWDEKIKVPPAMIEQGYTDEDMHLLWDELASEKKYCLILDTIKNTKLEVLARRLYVLGWHEIRVSKFCSKASRYLFWMIFKEPLWLMPLKINDEDREIRLVAKWRLMLGR